MKKVYVVFYVDNCAETWDIIKIFDSLEKAQEYCLTCAGDYSYVDVDEYEVF